VGSLDVVEHLPSIRELLIQKRPAHVLSRGQKQLLAIAMAFLQSPDVYLLDEPTNGLDPLAEAQVVELIQVATQGGAGVVIATHNLALQSIADRIIFMKRGRIVATRNAAAQSVVRCDLEVQPSAVSAALGIGFSRVDAGSMLTASGSPAEVAALICGLEPRDVLSLRVVDRAIASLYLDPE
jgi:energy-coupling factor transporter ATP-binding protein EcfA2